MLPFEQRVAFAVFALAAVSFAWSGLRQVIANIRSGQTDPDDRFGKPWSRLWYAFRTGMGQSRIFRKRPLVGIFHTFIFYGFLFYGIVNVLDFWEGYEALDIGIGSYIGSAYRPVADIFSGLILIGVVALVFRRFFLRSRRDFTFNSKVMLHSKIKNNKIQIDSIIVSTFIVFHVLSRVIGQAALISLNRPDQLQPLANGVSHIIPAHIAGNIYILSFWGAIGSIFLFLCYFPYSKHIHIVVSCFNYYFARRSNSGRLPVARFDEVSQSIGAGKLRQLSWPRLLDAYACIQCNRCQDVCPATLTGKSLSPAALELNKRMQLTWDDVPPNGPEQPALLNSVIPATALWTCTTCGACMQICPVQNEQMLDIVDIRRYQVMIEGEFPSQLQAAFRSMERAKNPWGIPSDQRMDWAEGLDVKTIQDNPSPDYLYWVGCAASFDPKAQDTARAFVELLIMAKVNFAVLGKLERCTGDSARRAGNEFLYNKLALHNIGTINSFNINKIVATCPHCFNALGNEYSQFGVNYDVIHHAQLLSDLVSEGRLPQAAIAKEITYHDPCYLGRHNGIFDAPRSILNSLGQSFVEMERHRENAFCCGGGGGQFWKEDEPGEERIVDNRYREAKKTFSPDGGILATGCPFCKSMFESVRVKDPDSLIQIKDIAEIMRDAVRAPPDNLV
jgi:Fe-S oxidoreductase